MVHKSAITIGTVEIEEVVHAMNNSWKLVNFKQIDQGIVNSVYELTVEPDKHLILKIGNPLWDSWKVENEVLGLRLIGQMAESVPTPRVLSVDTSKRILPYSYFVMEKLPGSSLQSLINQLPLDDFIKIVRNLAVYLKRIHDIGFPRFGALGQNTFLQVEDMVTIKQRSPTTFAGPYNFLREYYAAFVEARWQNVQNSKLKREAEILCKFIRGHLHLLDGGTEASLVHGDFQPSNIIVQGSTVTGLIDCEWVHAGCGEAEWFVARQRLLADISDHTRKNICAEEFDVWCGVLDLEQYHQRCKIYDADDCLISIEALPSLTYGMDTDRARQVEDRIRARVGALFL